MIDRFYLVKSDLNGIRYVSFSETKGKCFEASLFEGRKEYCSHRIYSLSPLHVAAEAGNTRLYKFILERTEDKNPIVARWRSPIFFLVQEWTPFLAAASYGNLETCLAIMDSLGIINPGNTQGLTPSACSCNRRPSPTLQCHLR